MEQFEGIRRDSRDQGIVDSGTGEASWCAPADGASGVGGCDATGSEGCRSGRLRPPALMLLSCSALADRGSGGAEEAASYREGGFGSGWWRRKTLGSGGVDGAEPGGSAAGPRLARTGVRSWCRRRMEAAEAEVDSVSSTPRSAGGDEAVDVRMRLSRRGGRSMSGSPPRRGNRSWMGMCCAFEAFGGVPAGISGMTTGAGGGPDASAGNASSVPVHRDAIAITAMTPSSAPPAWRARMRRVEWRARSAGSAAATWSRSRVARWPG